MAKVAGALDDPAGKKKPVPFPQLDDTDAETWCPKASSARMPTPNADDRKGDATIKARSSSGSETYASTSKAPAAELNAQPPKEGVERPVLLSKFTLYETKDKFYIVGSNYSETRFRVLTIELDQEMVLSENENVLSRTKMIKWLAKLSENAKAHHDTLNKVITGWGILGCIRFTSNWYLCLLTKYSVVAQLGGHFIYHIEETQLVPLVHSSVYRAPDRKSPESRLVQIFQTMDLAQTFYFSLSYDLTNTLQTNQLSHKLNQRSSLQEIYLWNSYLLSPLMERFEGTMDWCLAVIHGFIDQSKISVFGVSVFLTLIARRSHHFAGARFFKRGINNRGDVANEVETEQIVSNEIVSPLDDPRGVRFRFPRYTSYVQHRGSICLYWSQDTNNMSPKPPIRLDIIDPYYASAALHFDSLFKRYGGPIWVFNLVKTTEHLARESIISREFENCVNYLNQFLPKEQKIHMTSWDMSRAAKGRSSNVIEFLEKYADACISATGIYQAGSSLENVRIQEGVCRTNCVDCLDRTNAAQTVIAKCALAHQLKALGIIDQPYLAYDTDAMDLFSEMYHDHGDTLALQYGGSNLVNTMEKYRKINRWSSHSRDLIESFRRYYSNSFMDAQRQDAINVFLGNYRYKEGMQLWDMSTDYYLHNDFTTDSVFPRRSYRYWYSPLYLTRGVKRIKAVLQSLAENSTLTLPSSRLQLEHYWNRLYRPRIFTTLNTVPVMRLNSTDRYKHDQKGEQSPFAVHDGRKRSRRQAVIRKRPDVQPIVSASKKEDSEDVAIEAFYKSYVLFSYSNLDSRQSFKEYEEYVNTDLVDHVKEYEVACWVDL